MAKLMMDAIERVFEQELKTSDIDDVQQEIARLDDEEKIELLDKLIEATMNYNDFYRGPGRSSPIVPPVPSGDRGEAKVLPDVQIYQEAKAIEKA